MNLVYVVASNDAILAIYEDRKDAEILLKQLNKALNINKEEYDDYWIETWEVE